MDKILFKDFKEQVLKDGFQEKIAIVYVPVLEQNNLIEKIKQIAISTDINGIMKVDYMMRDVVTLILIVSNFTDIDISNEILNADGDIDVSKMLSIYDFLKESKIDEFLVNALYCEDFITSAYRALEQEVRIGNSLENVFAVQLTKFTEMIGKTFDGKNFKALVKELGKLDNNSIIGQLLNKNKGELN
jgi:hypothetical protein